MAGEAPRNLGRSRRDRLRRRAGTWIAALSMDGWAAELSSLVGLRRPLARRRLAAVKLYDSNIPSGNGYKVHLLLAHLGLPYTTEELDILASPSETRLPAFLAKNPNGRIPVLELDDGTCLPESNAILCYLAEGTPYLAAGKIERAQTLAWLFFEQYSHEPYVAVLKYWTYWGGLDHLSAEMKSRLATRGQQALDVMGQHLATRAFFVGERYGIADTALFAYTQAAAALGYAVPTSVERWLERVREQPGFVPIKRDPLGRAP